MPATPAPSRPDGRLRAEGVVSGRWGGSGPLRELRDPARTTDVIGVARWSTASDTAEAYAAAAVACRSWGAAPATTRAAVLRRAADLLDEVVDEAARALVLEEGKIEADARGEIRRSAATLRYHAGTLLAPQGSVYPPQDAALSVSRRHPLGVVTIITPFNYPMLVPAWKIAPALAHGNAVVWKCSELVPLSAARLAAALHQAGLPPGVLNLLIGGAELADSLLDAPEMRALSFTGSTAVGRAVARRAAGRGVRVQLELGGVNPAIVLDDIDADFVAGALTGGAMSATGQKCTAISLAVVVDGVYDEVAAALEQRVAALRVGHGLHPTSDVGPVVSAAAAERMDAAVAAAVQRGARVVTGGTGRPVRGGHFVKPTVLDGLAPDDPLLTQEVFGPLLILVRVRDAAQAVAVANRSSSGLNAAVFTRNLTDAMTVGEQITAGMVHLNAVSGFPPHIPFGGVKEAGFGPLEQGDTARDFFTETRLLHLYPHGAGR